MALTHEEVERYHLFLPINNNGIRIMKISKNTSNGAITFSANPDIMNHQFILTYGLIYNFYLLDGDVYELVHPKIDENVYFITGKFKGFKITSEDLVFQATYQSY